MRALLWGCPQMKRRVSLCTLILLKTSTYGIMMVWVIHSIIIIGPGSWALFLFSYMMCATVVI